MVTQSLPGSAWLHVDNFAAMSSVRSQLLLGCLLAAPVAGQALQLPPRQPGALTGSAILPLVRNLAVADREALVYREIVAGNVPDTLRRLIAVPTTAVVGGQALRATFWVTPDYVAVGSDADSFRMPMTATLAQQVADLTECALPTRKMVDAIWLAAPIQLSPLFFSPTSNNILAPSLFYQHHQRIEAQLASHQQPGLVGGIKKDVVVSPLVGQFPGRVVIYGWHQLGGGPIQPLSKVHIAGYADYSHGVRLVQRAMTVDDQSAQVAAVLADPVLHPLLSDEGAFTSSAYPVPQPPLRFPMVDPFPPSGPRLTWTAAFTPPVVQRFAPASPGGEGYVVVIQDPAGGTDSIRLGLPTDRDYAVQADVYCEYRPQLAAQGFERVGVFARDGAAGAFVGTNSRAGACYALTWDSDTGRLQCLVVAGGAVTALEPTPVYLPSTAWRQLRIEAAGGRLTFVVDGQVVLTARDGTFSAGQFGIGYREYFGDNRLMRGTRADNFMAHEPPWDRR